MVLSPRKCPGVEGKVCGHFLSSKEHDSHCLCVACRGKSCHPDDCCNECHEWSEEPCKSVSEYAEKLSFQREKKKERKTKSSSSSSFSDFSPSMPGTLEQLSSADSGVVPTSASSAAVCAITFTVAGPAVTVAPVTSMPVVLDLKHPLKRRRVTDPKEQELMLANFEDWWVSRRSTLRPGSSSASQPLLVTPPVVPVPGPSSVLAIPAAATLSAS